MCPQSDLHCSFKMTVWWQALILLCCILNLMDSAPSPISERSNYMNSFLLTRSTRTRVQQLLNEYNEQLLGNKHFEDRSRRLRDLPLLSTEFYSWLKLTDRDRLSTAFRDMHAYWNMLEWKRKELEREGKEQIVFSITLTQNIKHIQLDLRDLMNQVSTQLYDMKSSCLKPTSQTPMTPETSSKTVWDRRVEGYMILRDLNLYLTKLARDFLLLANKSHF